MSGNWIKLNRDIFKHTLFEGKPMSEREAWIWLLTKVAWIDEKKRVGGIMVNVPRGSYLATIREIMEIFSWASRKKIEQFLTLLEKENMIKRTIIGSGSTKRTLLSIVNYDLYQFCTEEHQDSEEQTQKTREDKEDRKEQKITNKKQKETNNENSNKLAYLENCFFSEGTQITGQENLDTHKNGDTYFIKENNNKYIYKKTNPIGLVKKENFDFQKNDFDDQTYSDSDQIAEDSICNRSEIILPQGSVLGLAESPTENQRGTQIGSFRPDLNFALQKGLSFDEAQLEAEKFQNYWLANGKTKKDWAATWRTWILSAYGPLAKKKEIRSNAVRISKKPSGMIDMVQKYIQSCNHAERG